MPEETKEDMIKGIEILMLKTIRTMIKHPEKFLGNYEDRLHNYIAAYKTFIRSDRSQRHLATYGTSLIGNSENS